MATSSSSALASSSSITLTSSHHTYVPVATIPEGIVYELQPSLVPMEYVPKRATNGEAWTHERFLVLSLRKYGPVFKFILPPKINAKTLFVSICLRCSVEIDTVSVEHFTDSKREMTCPMCTRRKADWSVRRFLTSSRFLYGAERYTYQFSFPMTSKSLVVATCQQCKNQWNTQPSYHIIEKLGCEKCQTGRHRRYTPERFLEDAQKYHPGLFHYDPTSVAAITGAESRVRIQCVRRGHIWEVTAASHISPSSLTRCAKCLYESRKHTKEDFIRLASAKHPPGRYDYSVTEWTPTTTTLSHIRIRCNVCQHIFTQKAMAHLEGRGCRKCKYQQMKITRDEFIRRSTEIHRDRYDYSVTVFDTNTGSTTKVAIKCNKCTRIFHQRAHSHYHIGNGCPFCRRSKGESRTANVLDDLGIEYTPQFRITRETLPPGGSLIPRQLAYLSDKRYDFYFTYQGHPIILEFDGEQHFSRSATWHSEDNEFETDRQRDVTKTLMALAAGYYMIRIDHTQIDAIEDQITYALVCFFPIDRVCPERLYVSSHELYSYITNSVRPGLIVSTVFQGVPSVEEAVTKNPVEEITRSVGAVSL